LALYGSALLDDFKSHSVVAVLAEFEPGARVGLIQIGAIEHELSELLRWPVDLNTAKSLSRYFRNEVLAEAECIYDTVQ
jgi:uncharacterized protein